MSASDLLTHRVSGYSSDASVGGHQTEAGIYKDNFYYSLSHELKNFVSKNI